LATGNAHTKWFSSKTFTVGETSAKYSLFRVCRKEWSQRSTAGLKNRLWVGHLRKCGSVPGSDERHIYF